MKLKNKYYKIVLLFLILFLLLLFINIYNSANFNRVKNGKIEISNNDELVELVGIWKFYPSQFVSGEKDSSSNYNEVKVPNKWNNYIFENKKFNSFGYGTYNIKIKFDKNREEIKLILPVTFGSSKIYIDNNLLYSNGNLSSKQIEEKFNLSQEIITVNTEGKNEIDLYYQLSNYTHGRSGLRLPIILGNSDSIDYFSNRIILKNSIILGILFLISIGILIISIIRRNKTYLFLVIATILLLLRNIFTGNLWITLLGIDINYSFSVYVDYLTSFFILSLYLILFNKILDKKYEERLYKIFLWFLGILMIATLFVPIGFLTKEMAYLLYFLVVLIPSYMYFILYKAIKDKNKNAYALLTFNLFIQSFAFHDILQINGKSLVDFQLLPTFLIIILISFFIKIYMVEVSLQIRQKNREERFELLESLPIGILEVTRSDRILFINNFLKKELNLEGNELKIRDFFDLDFWKFVKDQMKTSNYIDKFQKKVNNKIFQLTIYKREINESYNYLIIFDERTKEIKYENQIEKIMGELEIKVKKRTKSLSLFKEMIVKVSKLGDYTNVHNVSQNDFLKQVFKIGCDSLEKIDTGSIYLFDNSIVYFVDTLGHDLDILNSLELSVLDFSFPTNNMRFVSNITDRTHKKFNEKRDSEKTERYKKGVIQVKESILIGLSYNNKIVGGMSFEISNKSNEIFSKQDKEFFQILSNIFNSYYKNFRSLKKKEEKMLEEKLKLKNELMIDGLTGIFNKKYFNQEYKKYWNKSISEGKSISIIMIDIDNFKNYNDTYGHVRGDFVLREVANVLKVREDDITARYGGEEFIVLVFDTEAELVLSIAERIRKNVELLNIENYISENQSKLTISLGVATTKPEDFMKPLDLINLADKCLYEAKDNGRNQVVGRILKKRT